MLRADQAPGTPAVNNPDTEALATALIGAIAQATRAERPQVDDVVRHAGAHEFIARTRRQLLLDELPDHLPEQLVLGGIVDVVGHGVLPSAGSCPPRHSRGPAGAPADRKHSRERI